MSRFSNFTKIKLPTADTTLQDSYEKMYDAFLHEKYRESQKIGRQILKTHPEHTPTLLLFAQMQSSRKHYDKAIEYYSKILKKDSTHDEALAGRAASFFGLFKFEEALLDYLDLHDLTPHEVRYIIKLADTYQRLKLDKIALRFYHQAVETDQESIPAHIGIAYHLLTLGRYREAREHADSAKRLYQENKPEQPKYNLENIKDLEKQLKQLG